VAAGRLGFFLAAGFNKGVLATGKHPCGREPLICGLPDSTTVL